MMARIAVVCTLWAVSGGDAAAKLVDDDLGPGGRATAWQRASGDLYYDVRGDLGLWDSVFTLREPVELANASEHGLQWTEGPVYVAVRKKLLFSDTISARIYESVAEFDELSPPRVLLEDSGGNPSDESFRAEPGSNALIVDGARYTFLARVFSSVVHFSSASLVCAGCSFASTELVGLSP
jgi:hypothetical protein